MNPRPLEEVDPELAGRFAKIVASHEYIDPKTFIRITGECRVLLFRHGETMPFTEVASDPLNRNDPCPCGSGVKFKKCCGR